MGCCSSREADAAPAGNERSSPAASNTRLTTTNPNSSSQTGVSQSVLSRSSNQILSPATSRAALETASSPSLPSAPGVSTPRLSSNRHRFRSTTTDASSSNLTEHYNLPLQRPRPWKSQSKMWSRAQLRRERQDFFDTRVTGQKEIWEALRQVTGCIRDGDILTAQGILDALNVTLPTGHVEDGCYDERGFLYKMPEEILSDPVNIQPDEAEVDGETVVGIPADAKAKLSADALVEQAGSAPKEILEKHEVGMVEKAKDSVPQDAIQLKCRLSDTGSDVATYIGRSESVSLLAVRLKSLVPVPAYARVEVFYLGKKLDQKKTLLEQDYTEKHVLNVFVVGAPK